MWTTGNDIYVSFTDGIRRTSQSVVPKSKFVRLWNEWALPEWMKINTSIREGVELTQKQIEDLQSLIVKTDGVDYNPIYTTGTNIFPLPIEHTSTISINTIDPTTFVVAAESLPICTRVLRVWFKLSPAGSWIKSYPLRTIDESFVLNSKYSAPSSTLLYHRTYNNKIEAVTPIGYTATMMELMYIRYPNQMEWNDPTIDYTLDLHQEQLEEVRDIAVRLYLERVKDPRWQSFLQEEMLKNIISK